MYVAPIPMHLYSTSSKLSHSEAMDTGQTGAQQKLPATPLKLWCA